MFSGGHRYCFGTFCFVLLVCLFCCPVYCDASADIQLTSVPAYGEYGNLSGTVSGVNPADHKVLVYIYVSGWWNKPSWADPETSIASDGTWQCNISGYDSDIYATEIMAVLVPNGSYQSLWQMGGNSTLPSDLLSHPFVNAYRTPRTISFAGHNWAVKSGYNGPGPNNFSDSADNVWVDGNGYLHLKITNQGGQWDCAEIISVESFGHGTYVYTVDSRVDLLDQNIVLGLFTWDTYAPEYNYREIDFEFSRWKNPANDIGQYVIQPWNTAGNMYRFDFDYAGQSNTTTHVMTWRPDGIYFKSYYGGFSLAPPPDDMIVDWHYTGSDNPPAGGENARMNLWLIDGSAPSDGQEAEIVISDFQFLSGISDQPADINDDDSVTLGDFSKVAAGWQNTVCGVGNTWCGEADLTCNGIVDTDDVLALIDYWMESLN